MAACTLAKSVLLAAGLVLSAPVQSRQERPPEKVVQTEKTSGAEQAPASHELYESGHIGFSAPPPTVVAAGVQCDANGNVYLVYGASFEATSAALRSGVILPVSKLSLDSRTVVQFPLDQLSDYAEYQRKSFYVDPRGRLYALVLAYRHGQGDEEPDWPDSLIVEYKDDGTMDSVVRLRPSREAHFEAWRFAAFLDGSFLVAGVALSEKHMPKQPLTGLFDRGGAFVAPLTLPHDVRPEVSRAASTPVSGGSAQLGGAPGAGQAPEGRKPERPWIMDVQQGIMVGSLDGNVYMLRATSPARLYVITPAGSVLRDVVLKAPSRGEQPIQMSLAGQNRLLLKFVPTQPRGPQSREHLALLDINSGKIADTYNLPPGASGTSACVTPQNEFLFLGTSKDNQLEVVKYAAR